MQDRLSRGDILALVERQAQLKATAKVVIGQLEDTSPGKLIRRASTLWMKGELNAEGLGLPSDAIEQCEEFIAINDKLEALWRVMLEGAPNETQQ